MSRKKLAVALAVVAVYIGSFGSVRAFSPQPGSQDDPLITVSYLNQVLQPILERLNVDSGAGQNTSLSTLTTVIQQLELRIVELENKVAKLEGSATKPPTPTTPSTPSQPSTPTTPAPIYGYINGNMVNIRTGPGTNFAIIATLANNTKLEVLERGKEWHKVKYQDKVAYVTAQFFRIP